MNSLTNTNKKDELDGKLLNEKLNLENSKTNSMVSTPSNNFINEDLDGNPLENKMNLKIYRVKITIGNCHTSSFKCRIN